jgi:hypothetical protein
MAAILKRLSKPVLLLFVPLLLMSPLLLTGKVMFWGTVSLQFLPWSILATRILQGGQLPLWNPLVGMGAPLLANYQSGLLYPPNWLVLLSDGIGGAGWAAWMQTWLVTLHLIWAGLGMFFLARQIGIKPLGRIVCGLSFALSGYLVSRSAFISINATVAWAPWLILSVTWLARGKTTFIKVVTIGIIACMLFLAGHAQTAWYAILFSFAWMTLIAWQDADAQLSCTENILLSPLRFKTKFVLLKWVALFFSMGLGACLAAIQLIPTAELLMQSQRAKAVDFNYAMTYSFWPWRFLTLLAPGLFGSPVSGDYWGYGNYWEDALYIGVLPFILALTMLIGVLVGYPDANQTIPQQKARNAQPHLKTLTIFLLGVIIVSFVLALGKNTPVFPWFYYNIPTFAAFQAPTRFAIWAVISLTLLAGMGVDRLKRPKGRALYWTRLGTAGAGAITLGAGLAWYFLGDISPTFIGPTALFGFFAMFTGILVLTAPAAGLSGDNTSLRGSAWEWALLLLLGLDLLLANWNLNPGIEKDFYRSMGSSPGHLSSVLAGGRLYLNPDNEYDLKFYRFMRFDSYQIDEDWDKLREVQLPNINILDGISSVNNFDPMVPARYARWMDALGKIGAASDGGLFFRLLNLMGVSAVEYLSNDEPSAVGFQPVENSNRIRWVDCAKHARNGEEAWNLVFNGKTNFDDEVIIEKGDSVSYDTCIPSKRQARVTVIDEQPNWIKMSVNSPRAGWLVLSDLWYPGWKVEVDGQPTPIFRANYLFRAINVPSGVHTVIWRYSPESFWIGFMVSAVAWILVGIFCLLTMTRRWRKR